MPDTTGSRTEPPSQRRLREAREKGQVAFSHDLTASIVMLAGATVILWRTGAIGTSASAIVRRCLEQAVSADRSVPHVMAVAAQAAWDLALITLPILAVIVLAGAAASFLQVGPLLTARPLALRMEALNPAKGLRDLFFSRRAAVESAGSLLKFVVAGSIGVAIVWQARGQFARLSSLEPSAATAWALAFITRLVFGILLAFAVLAIADILYRRWQHRRDLMMTRDEAQRDLKQEEGDPRHRIRRRTLRDDVSLGAMLQSVPRADVVIAGPDTIACALRWDGDEGSAPRLVAKGSGLAARSIKIAAASAGVPILHRESLAAALHHLPLNADIPGELYKEVSAALEWADEEAQLSGRVPNWRKQEVASA